MTALIEARNLVRLYPGGVRAVDGLSFQVAPGECFGLLGPNGAGKTTTLEMLEGIQTPTSGEVLCKGRSLGQDSIGDHFFYRFNDLIVNLRFSSSVLHGFLLTV